MKNLFVLLMLFSVQNNAMSQVTPASCFQEFMAEVGEKVEFISLALNVCTGAKVGISAESGKEKSAPVACIRATGKIAALSGNPLAKAKLCRRAESIFPAQCFEEVLPVFEAFEKMDQVHEKNLLDEWDVDEYAKTLNLGLPDSVNASVIQPNPVENAALLCSRAETMHPMNCFQEAYNNFFSLEEAVLLCKGATSLAPLNCVGAGFAAIHNRMMRDFPGPNISRRQILGLCAGAADEDGPYKCLRKTGKAPHEEKVFEAAIQLCAGAGSDAPVRCAELARLNQVVLTGAQALDLCRGTATLDGFDCVRNRNSLGLQKELSLDSAARFCNIR